jgi:hypothetical protein
MMRERRRETEAARTLSERLACVLCGEQAAVALLLGPDDNEAPLLVGGFCAACWATRGERDARAA